MTEVATGAKAIWPKLLSPCQFSALQPLLSTGYSIPQVKSLLALALLFWQKPTFSDTQIADSPLLYQEFLHPARESLAPLVRECLKSGEARLLMRDGFYAGPNEKIIDCTNLIDVFRGWQKQDIANAWVVPRDAQDRERFVGAWNEVAPQKFTLTYDYIRIKGRFQQMARDAGGWPGLHEQLGEELYRKLKTVLDSNWFSHSNIYALLNGAGLGGSDWAQRFGLIDEAAYAEFFQAGIAAINVPATFPQESDSEADEATEYVNRVMSEAFSTVNVDSLTLLHLLTFDEIMEIRKRGASLLDLVRTMGERTELSERDLHEMALSLAGYWRLICDEIARLHPGAAKARTKLGLALSRQSIVPVEDVVEGIAVVLSGLTSLLTGGVEGQKGIIRKVIDTVSFRFLLSSESGELKEMRRALSRNAVLSAKSHV